MRTLLLVATDVDSGRAAQQDALDLRIDARVEAYPGRADAD
ncbi:hypothetical protein [Geodermatophilus normandii]|nr:hypothetical protein [Geodermatophilus normandii]